MTEVNAPAWVIFILMSFGLASIMYWGVIFCKSLYFLLKAKPPTGINGVDFEK